MSKFIYRAKKGPSEIVTGTLDASNRDAAVERLSQMGYLPVSVEEEAASIPETSGIPTDARASAPVAFFSGVRAREVTVFSRQLATLIKSGVPILRAIVIIQEQSDSPVFRDILGRIARDVKEGKSFSEGLEAWPRVFGPFFIAMVRAGEGSGTLQEALIRVAIYRQKQEAMVAHVRAALAYPVLMALVGAGTVIFMFVFVLPKLTTIFTTMGQVLPWPTRAVIAISDFLRSRGWFVIFAGAGVGFAAARTSSWKARRRFMSRFWLHVPVAGRFVLMTELARFCRTLEVLIKSGIPILKALGISIPILSNEVIKADLARSALDLEQGATLAASLRRSKVFPTYMVSLIAVGEESGRLDDALGEVATAYEESCDEAVRVMTSLLEPLMILGMGLVVGFIVMAMLLPIFEMNTMVR